MAFKGINPRLPGDYTDLTCAICEGRLHLSCEHGCRPGFQKTEDDPQPYPPVRECISREAMRERERCILLVWENRGKCASNQTALALMDLINGEI